MMMIIMMMERRRKRMVVVMGVGVDIGDGCSKSSVFASSNQMGCLV